VANSELWRHGTLEYFELGPPSNWFMKITNQELEWKPPQADPKIAQSCYCNCNNSPDFCGEVGSLAMFCTTCDGDSHLCRDLYLHYQYFSSQDLPKVSGIIPHEVKETKRLNPLPFLSYTKLIKNYYSLQKAVRVLAIQSFMESILENMHSTTTSSSPPELAQAAVLLQPGMMGTLRRFVPSEEN